jgi:hypothetical protein
MGRFARLPRDQFTNADSPIEKGEFSRGRHPDQHVRLPLAPSPQRPCRARRSEGAPPFGCHAICTGVPAQGQRCGTVRARVAAARAFRYRQLLPRHRPLPKGMRWGPAHVHRGQAPRCIGQGTLRGLRPTPAECAPGHHEPCLACASPRRVHRCPPVRTRALDQSHIPSGELELRGEVSLDREPGHSDIDADDGQMFESRGATLELRIALSGGAGHPHAPRIELLCGPAPAVVRRSTTKVSLRSSREVSRKR